MTDILSESLAPYVNLASSSQTASIEISPSDGWSDAEVLERLQAAPPLPDAVFTIVSCETLRSNVFVLCRDTVAKKGLYSSLCSEALALQFVRSHTSIPVPKVRRCIEYPGSNMGCLLLEKIEDVTRLDRLWSIISPFQRFLTAWTLRGYIHELHRASATYPRRHIPGPMGDIPKRCRGPSWLFPSRGRGPFRSSAELVDEYNRVFKNDKKFGNSEQLVLTHNDLNMRNILVGKDGMLWVVDWEWSGFYPVWFEYIATMSAAENDDAPKSWWKHIPLVTGAWVKEKNMLGYKNL